MTIIIGTAGWSIPTMDAASFGDEGTSLERYSRVFDGVEVNSSFHRSHRRSTWARWAAAVPEQFRFSVKLPKTITHQARLVDTDHLLEGFLEEISPLGSKLAVLLVQLPPKLSFDMATAERFFAGLRRSTEAAIACEPRHASWFEQHSDALLDHMQVARVAADPARGIADAADPGGWKGLAYWRLHGSPTIYRSSYGDEALADYARQARAATGSGRQVWCVFDNTAASAATANALSMMRQVEPERRELAPAG